VRAPRALLRRERPARGNSSGAGNISRLALVAAARPPGAGHVPPNDCPMHWCPMHTPNSGKSGPSSLQACSAIPDSSGAPAGPGGRAGWASSLKRVLGRLGARTRTRRNQNAARVHLSYLIARLLVVLEHHKVHPLVPQVLHLPVRAAAVIEGGLNPAFRVAASDWRPARRRGRCTRGERGAPGCT